MPLSNLARLIKKAPAFKSFPGKKHLVVALSGAGLLALFMTVAGLRLPGAEQPLSIAAHAAEQAKSAKAPAGEFSASQKSGIEAVIKAYLLKNPEILIEMQTALQARQEEIEAARQKVAIKRNAKELFHRPNSAIAGNPKGDVTIVEFFDYNCGFCKRALDNITNLVKQDSNVRVVFKEFPILSKGSEEAARVALAARIQGKYWEVHSALLTAPGRASKASALKIAAGLGLDMAKLKTDMTSAPVTEEIASTRALAEKMGINGTPHFIVGDNAIAGAPGQLLQMLGSHIKDIRKNGCTVC